ncbi:MAG: CheY-like receiver AAA-type ATPase and DNA-binding domain-containing response [Desulfobulbaceae bacterium]|nr:MAG: CheY-like receiver AAA-type ATPase and DNA-binding domain-containing response [Desulfobulbaceae bacterium]
MNTVLIVDDDESFLLSLIDGFKSYEDQFGIITAHNGEQAVDILDKQEIHLVLTDLKMPKMDGFALVAHLSSHHPEIPVIVMTAFGTPDIEENLKKIKALQYIEKPIDFNLLVSKILKGLEGRSKGFITGVSLSSLLQLLQLDKKTCTVTVRSGKHQGTLYFRNGDLLDANTDDLSGEDAAFTIISWKNVDIVLDNSCAITKPEIHKSLGFILLEGSRRQDEQNASPTTSAPQTAANSLDSIDLSSVDLGSDHFLQMDEKTLPPASSRPAEALTTSSSTTTSSAHTANPILQQFITMLSAMPEISNSILVSKEGNLVYAAKTADAQISNFITYISVVSQQLQESMGMGGQQYTMLTLSSGSNLLILSGKEIVVGLKMSSTVPPGPVAAGLRPVLSRIRLQ